MGLMLIEYVTRNTQPRCDAEIGRPGGLWHACRNRATHFQDRQHSTGGQHRIYFCGSHALRDPGSPSVRVINAGTIQVGSCMTLTYGTLPIDATQRRLFLYCPLCAGEFSAHKGDYWLRDQSAAPICYQCEEPLRLMRRREMLEDVTP